MVRAKLRSGMRGKAVLVVIAVLMFLALAACARQQPVVEPSSDSESTGPAPVDNLDLSNSADRILLNRCLSWMSQAFESTGLTLDVSDPNDQVAFAVHHLALTDRDTWEFGDYTSLAGPGGGAQRTTNVRVATGYIDDVVYEFFGCAPDYDSLDGMYKHIDDYIYFGVTAPAGQSPAYSAITELTPLGDGLYSVSFEAYSSDMPYEEKDDAFYASTPSEMMAALGKSAPWCTGTATVRATEQDGKVSLIVESYGTDVADEPAAEPTVIATPYYTITIPAGWPEEYQGGLTYEVDEELQYADRASGLGLGCEARVKVGSGSLCVSCFTDNWGLQGDFVSRALGPLPSLPGWSAVVYTSRVDPNDRASTNPLAGLLDEFASFVTLTAVSEAPSASDSATAGASAQKADFAARLDAINAEKSSDRRMAGSTYEMNAAGADYMGRFKSLMDDVLGYLYTLPSIDSGTLAAAQEAWHAETDARAESVASEYAGGTLASINATDVWLQAYDERISFLIDMIP